MTRQEFIDEMFDYGTHIVFVYGVDKIRMTCNVNPNNSYLNYFPHIHSDGRQAYMEFTINQKKASINDCIKLINIYNRNKRIDSIIKK